VTASAPTTLLLDIGGVLLTNGWDRAARRAAADLFGLDWADFNERHHLCFAAYEEGRLDLGEYLDRVVFHRERPFSRQAFRSFMFAQSKPLPDTLALFRSLKTRYGLHLAAVTNEGRELAEHRFRELGLRGLIDVFVCSAFVQRRKPDPEIYRLALELLQVPPGEAVYVEDRRPFVEAAGALGIRSIHHVGCEATREALGAVGLGRGDV
jgi:putative hydrolase of the HAD superfamily